MHISFVDIFAFIMLGIKCLLYFVALIFLISGIDDLVVDIAYALRYFYRLVFIRRVRQPVTEEQLCGVPEQPIAVMIPAWNESAIIYPMIDNTASTLTYSNYHIFVGTYPNDLATQNEVERLREKHDNIHRVVCRDPGPTSKADCLNWIYWSIRDFERQHNMEFPVFVMEDAEDIIHPLALKLFNYLIPRKDMVQLPVVPFEAQHWYQFTRNHYMDEFAENHHKNMVIREFMGRGIPCAGVGGGFSRKALETLAGENPQHVVFRLGSLTEDYEMGMRLNAIGIKKAIFVKWPIYRTVTQKRLFGRGTKKVTVRELISIRNVFPKDFTAAVRQKARWIAGIALQGWENLGWEGDLLTKYVLFKDRKALVTCQINVLGYVVFLSVMFYYAVIWLAPDAYRFPPLVEEGTLLWYLIIITTVFLIHRIILRMFCVYKFYGIKQSLTAIPNLVWSSFINFFATNRALHLFYNYLVTGQWIKWDHTAHVPPTEEELQSFRRRIGDMLVEKRIITIKELEGVLEEQKQSGKMLGDILIGKGMVSEDELLQTLGVQLRVSTREIDPYETSLELLKLFPRELAVKHSIYPAEIRNNKLIVAASHMVAKEILGQVETVTGYPVELCLTTKSTLSFAIRRGYDRLEQDVPDDRPRLGDVLLEEKILSKEQLEDTLRAQRRTYARLGDILLEEEYLTPDQLDKAAHEYSPASGELFGEYLVRHGYITTTQLEHATAMQKKKYKSLGQILLDKQMVTKQILDKALKICRDGAFQDARGDL